jgi:GGDEF domain-containing protein
VPVETPVEAKQPGTRVEIGRGGAGITAEPVNLPPVIDVERRKNTARRKKLDEMTPQELREELRVDRPTGMMTRRALEEDGYRKAVASVDVDGLKRVNDTIGHIAGDELLKRVADELRRSGLKPYRTGGDEIQITSDDPKRLQRALDGALKRLAGVKIQNGPLANTGISFTYGVADNFESADQIAIQNKTAKKAAGIIPTRKGEAITLTEGEKRTEAATPQQTEKPKAPAQKEPKPTKKAQKSKKAAQVKQPESEPQAASDAAFDLGGTPAAAQATGPKGEPLVVRSRQKAPGKPGEKRGVGHIMSVLHKAATKGIINESEARFVSWFLKKNEALVSDLEARTTRRGGGAEAGWYKPAERLMLIIGNSKEGLTAVHEILHHLERMMPSSMQDAIRTEWQKQVEAKLAGGTLNQAEQDYMRAVLDAWNGDPKARRHAYNLLVSGQVDIPKFYRYFNPSEFFAVNGSELMQRRYQSSGNIWSRIHNWMKEAVEHMKRWLGNRNASIALKAIDALVNGGAGGKIPKGRKMLSQQPGAAYGMLRTGPRLLYRILRVPVSPSIVAKLYPEFAPVWRMGEAAQQNEEVISKLFHRRLKAVGEALERSGNRDANVETLTDAMFMEDILQREFTDQELTNAGVAGNVRSAYILLRSAYKQAIRMTNRVRALEGLPPVTERAGYVPRVFHNWRIRSASGENLATAETLAEAIKIAKTYPDPQNLLISPGAYQNQIPGQYAVALGDKEFTRALLKLAEAQGITVDEAADMLRGVQTPSRKNRAFAHFKKRTGVSGYSEDLLAVSRGYFDGIARYAAMAPFKKRARSYFERHPDFGEFDNEKWPNDESGIGPYIKDYISRVNGDIGKVEQYLNSAIAKHPLLSQYFGERSSREIASAITTGVSIVKLGFFAPLSMLVNLTQYNNIRGLIGDRSAAAGAVRASVVLAELMRRRFVTKSSKHRSGDIGIVERSGVLLQQSLDGMDVYGGKKTGISKAAKAGRATLAGFHGVELWLRMTAVLGAHHKAIKDGKSRQQAIAEAQEINRLANFNNGVADTPEIISALGPVGSVVGQFKKFPIKQAELLAGMSGMEHVRWWIPFIIASGLFNLPGDELLRKLFEWATGKDYEVEAKKVLDELVEEGELPESVADTAKYGIAAPVADIDLSRRVGQGDIIPTRLSDIPGPFLGTFWRAVQQAAEGNWIETIKQIAPFPGNVLEQATTNGDLESVWNRDRLVTTLTPSEKAVKAIGGQPVRVSKIKDAERAAAYQARLERDVRTRIIDNILDLEERLDSADDPDAIQDKIDALYDEAEEKNVRITATMLKNARDARETPAAERIRDRVSPEVEEELEATINAVEEDELETDEELENGR